MSSIANIVPACMSCTMSTVPQISIPSDNSLHFNVDDEIEIIPSNEYFCSEMNNTRTTLRPVTQRDIFEDTIPFYPHRVDPVGKSNRKNRKYHNIYQPGRTNCTQRYQTK